MHYNIKRRFPKILVVGSVFLRALGDIGFLYFPEKPVQTVKRGEIYTIVLPFALVRGRHMSPYGIWPELFDNYKILWQKHRSNAIVRIYQDRTK